jgi:hypothetical protein
MHTLKTTVALVLLAVAGQAVASLAVPATVEDLARTSDAVVRGRVSKITARWSSDGRRILTYIEVETSSVWQGSAPSHLTVVAPGGVVGNIGQHVDGAPEFSQGEEVVLFLGKLGKAFRVRGLAQGKFSVVNEKAQPDVSAFSFVQGKALRAGERRVEAMTTEELEHRVKTSR